MDKTTTHAAIVGRGPARLWLEADFDVLAVERDVWPSISKSILPLSRIQFGQQLAAALFRRASFLTVGMSLPSLGPSSLKFGYHLVVDVLVAGRRELDCLTFSSSAITSACSSSHAWCVVSARITSTFASGWRTFRLAALRALRPSEEIWRTRFIRSESASSIAAASPVG